MRRSVTGAFFRGLGVFVLGAGAGIQVDQSHASEYAVQQGCFGDQSEADGGILGPAWCQDQSGNDSQLREYLTNDLDAGLCASGRIDSTHDGGSSDAGDIDFVAGHGQGRCSCVLAVSQESDHQISVLVIGQSEVGVLFQSGSVIAGACGDDEILANDAFSVHNCLLLIDLVGFGSQSSSVGFRIQYVDEDHRADRIQIACQIHGLAERIFAEVSNIAELLHGLSGRGRQNRLVNNGRRIVHHVNRRGTDNDLHRSSSFLRNLNGSVAFRHVYAMFDCHVF